MLIPVRCFTCGKPIGHLHEEFNRLVAQYSKTDGYTSRLKAFEKVGIEKYCCKITLMTYPDIADTILKYSYLKKEHYMQAYDEPNESETKKDILYPLEPDNESDSEELETSVSNAESDIDETDSEEKLIVEKGEDDESNIETEEEGEESSKEAEEEDVEESSEEAEDD